MQCEAVIQGPNSRSCNGRRHEQYLTTDQCVPEGHALSPHVLRRCSILTYQHPGVKVVLIKGCSRLPQLFSLMSKLTCYSCCIDSQVNSNCHLSILLKKLLCAGRIRSTHVQLPVLLINARSIIKRAVKFYA